MPRETEALGQDADAPPDPDRLLRTDAVDLEATRRGFEDRREHPDRGGLPGAVRAEEAEDPARREREGQRPQGTPRAVRAVDVVRDQDRTTCCPISPTIGRVHEPLPPLRRNSDVL
jgi:hypothetical protein